jgi:NADH-quinone oxidoreductase subunit K
MKLLLLAIYIFFIGLCGLTLMRRHLLLMLISIELIFLAINYNLILSSYYLDDMLGQVYSLALLSVAASEAAIGLALVVVFYKLNGSIAIDAIKKLNGYYIKK